MIIVCKFPCSIFRHMLTYKHIEGYRYRLSDKLKIYKLYKENTMKQFIMAILVAIISTSSVMGAVWFQARVQHTGLESTVKVSAQAAQSDIVVPKRTGNTEFKHTTTVVPVQANQSVYRAQENNVVPKRVGNVITKQSTAVVPVQITE